MERVTLTTKTETDQLIGAKRPSEKKKGSFEWVDGPVPRAFAAGKCLFLDNLSEPEAMVVERLNALFEVPPSLHVTESQESAPRDVGKGFWVVATMPDRGPLSPALLDRFAVLRMDEDCDPRVPAVLAQSCLDKICDSALLALSGEPVCGLREKARYLKCLSQLEQSGTKLDLPQLLVLRPLLTTGLEGYISVRAGELFMSTVCEVLGLRLPSSLVTGAPASWPGPKGKFCMTPKRQDVTALCCLALQCRQVIILQGEPSIGKTAIVSYLAVQRRCNEMGRALEVVPNSDSTGIEHYVGSFVVKGAQCEFRKGPLLRAVENGNILLADEINLAPSDLLSFLMPIFEGHRTIYVPLLEKTVDVHPDFRFIGTQNPPGYSGRKALPEAMTSRCLVVNYPGFDKDEMSEILALWVSAAFKARGMTSDAGLLEEMAQEMLRILKWTEDSKLTLRQFIRWIARARFPSSSHLSHLFSGCAVGLFRTLP